MVRSIAIAALLERYSEAAQLRDELAMFRASLGISVGEEGWGESGSGSLQQQDQVQWICTRLRMRCSECGRVDVADGGVAVDA